MGETRVARKRKASAAGYLIRDRRPLPEDRRGIAISTLGKVIKRGWDWLGLTPAAPDHVGGLIEAPPLAECLTLNKADFIRVGARGAVHLAYRKGIQEAVAVQLSAWGDLASPEDPVRRRVARPVERDLASVLGRLAEDFPLLSTLVDQRAGGQRQLPMGKPGGPEEGELAAPFGSVRGEVPAARVESEAAGSDWPAPGIPPTAAPETADVPGTAVTMSLATERGRRQPARFGLSLQFVERPEDPEPARLVESTVWINQSHPAYRRAVTSRSEGYHLAVAVASHLPPWQSSPSESTTS